jgi:hypothetical protein
MLPDMHKKTLILHMKSQLCCNLSHTSRIQASHMSAGPGSTGSEWRLLYSKVTTLEYYLHCLGGE